MAMRQWNEAQNPAFEDCPETLNGEGCCIIEEPLRRPGNVIAQLHAVGVQSVALFRTASSEVLNLIRTAAEHNASRVQINPKPWERNVKPRNWLLSPSG